MFNRRTWYPISPGIYTEETPDTQRYIFEVLSNSNGTGVGLPAFAIGTCEAHGLANAVVEPRRFAQLDVNVSASMNGDLWLILSTAVSGSTAATATFVDPASIAIQALSNVGFKPAVHGLIETDGTVGIIATLIQTMLVTAHGIASIVPDSSGN
jgi:hypothetical protein